MSPQKQPLVESARLKVENAAAHLGISANTLSVWQHRRQGVPSFRMGSGDRGRYRDDLLEAWLTEQRQADSHSNPVPTEDAPKEKWRSRNVTGSPRELDVTTYLSLRNHDEFIAFVPKARHEIELCTEQAETVFTENTPATSAAYPANARVAPWG